MFCGHCAGEVGVGETGCQQGHVGQLVNRSFAASYKSPHHHHRQRQRQRQRRRQRSRLNISHDIFDRFRLTRNKPTKHFVPVPPLLPLPRATALPHPTWMRLTHDVYQ